MKNETNLFKRIRNIIVGNTLPKNEDLWIDTSNGEKNAVLKYKGNPLGGNGEGGGTTSGIPTINKNTQPNIVWREPTEEDLTKLSNNSIVQVADLPNGQVPIFLVYVVPNDTGIVMLGVIEIHPPLEGEGGSVTTGDGSRFLLSEDWSLLGIVGNG